MRPRLSDADRRRRGAVPHLGAVSSRAIARRALGRPGLRHRVAIAGVGDRGARPHLSPLAQGGVMADILITGATGFIGLPCLERLLRAGHQVHAVCRHPLPMDHVHWHAIDLLNPEQVSALLASIRPSYLLHLAWIATPGVYWTSPENHGWVDASLHLVRQFHRWGGRRAVLAGTCAEYDWSYPLSHETTTPLRPMTPYGQCKLQLWQQVRQEKLSMAWARLFFLYGPREHPAR